YTNCSWGIYANGAAPAGGNRTVAYRGFAAPLATNTTFMIQWMSEGIGFAPTNYAGFALRNGIATNNETTYQIGYRFELYFAGGTGSFQIKDGNGTTTTIGVPHAAAYGNAANGHVFATGLQCEFTLQTTNTYRLVLRSVTTGQVLAFLDNQPLA